MISNVSHEFWTPLNAIILNSEFIEKKLTQIYKNVSHWKPDIEVTLNEIERVQKYNRIIHVSGKLNLFYVNDILDLGRLENDAF